MLFNFCDIDVYERDAALFKDGQWLNDTCISLRFRRIEQQNNCQAILLMDPPVVSFLRFQVEDDDELEELSNGIGLHSKQWLLFPLNDNSSLTSVSTHWSLLLCHKTSGALFHFDSNNGHNNSAAFSASHKIGTLIGR